MFSGSDHQRALTRNAKAGDVAGDENAMATTMATKSKLLKNSSLGDGDSRKTMLSAHKPTILGESKRTVMVDKSNHHDLTLAPSNDNKDTTSGNRPPQQQPSETLHTQRKSLSTVPTTAAGATTTATRQEAQQKTETAASAQAEHLAEFFKDNKERYKSATTEGGKQKKKMEPTSIIPIQVPDRLKPTIREKYLSKSTNSKRTFDGMRQRSEQLLSSLKRQKQLDQQLSDDNDHPSKSKGKENVDPNSPPGLSTTTAPAPPARAAPAAITRSISSPSSQQTIVTISSACSSPSSNSQPPRQPPPAPRRPTAAPSNTTSSTTQLKATKPTFSTIESKNFELSELNVDQETYEEAKKHEQMEERRSQQNLLQNNQVSQKHGVYDDDESNDPMLVAEYADEILSYLRSTEAETLVNCDYVSTIQHEVTWRMRDVLIDWVIEVHYIFQLLPETLFLAVNIIDRFLAQRDVSMGKLQLVGVASLFVATKFEETIAPPIKQYLYVTGNMVTEEELLKSERYILQILDFKLCYPNPFHFLRKSTMVGNFDVHIRFLSKYFMEITIIDHRFLGTPPSLVAASALWLAIKILCRGGWTAELVTSSGYTVQDVKPTVELILDYLSQPIVDKSFYKKWSSRRMMRVSAFVRDWVHRFYG